MITSYKDLIVRLSENLSVFQGNETEETIKQQIKDLQERLTQVEHYKKLLSSECEIFPVGTIVEEELGISEPYRQNRAKIIGYKCRPDRLPSYVVEFPKHKDTEDFWEIGADHIKKAEISS